MNINAAVCSPLLSFYYGHDRCPVSLWSIYSGSVHHDEYIFLKVAWLLCPIKYSAVDGYPAHMFVMNNLNGPDRWGQHDRSLTAVNTELFDQYTVLSV